MPENLLITPAPKVEAVPHAPTTYEGSTVRLQNHGYEQRWIERDREKRGKQPRRVVGKPAYRGRAVLLPLVKQRRDFHTRLIDTGNGRPTGARLMPRGLQATAGRQRSAIIHESQMARERH